MTAVRRHPGCSRPRTTPASRRPNRPTRRAAQAPQQQPAIELASAPIGGNVDVDGSKQCAEVNWLGRNPIPDGTTIKLGTPGLDPGGVFDFDQSSCAGDLRPCTDVQWQSSSFQACYVGVRQVANGSKDVSLIIPVAATCASQEDCDSLANGSRRQSDHLLPGRPRHPHRPRPPPAADDDRHDLEAAGDRGAGRTGGELHHKPSSGDTPNGEVRRAAQYTEQRGHVPSSAGHPTAQTPNSAGTPSSGDYADAGADRPGLPRRTGARAERHGDHRCTGARADRSREHPDQAAASRRSGSPNAPIGGDRPLRRRRRPLRDVNWLGKEPIPDGTTITSGRSDLEPRGVFTLRQSACGGRRPCSGISGSRAIPSPATSVPASYVSSSDEVRLIIPASAVMRHQGGLPESHRGLRRKPDLLLPRGARDDPERDSLERDLPRRRRRPETTPDETPSGG